MRLTSSVALFAVACSLVAAPPVASRAQQAPPVRSSGANNSVPRPVAPVAPVAPPSLPAGPFALRDGDRVVFYGDSITEQRQYTAFVEDFVRTRFPALGVEFRASGWGGDRVSGGGGGSQDVRLSRDVIAHRPTVVTTLFGMNDAGYRKRDDVTQQAFQNGYRTLLARLRKDVPGVRLTLLEPSPYDDVTRAPDFDGGYNGVLVGYGAFVKNLAAKENAQSADLNAPVVAALGRAVAIDPQGAARLLPDRVHPAPGIHLVMAGALLKAWNAPALVSSVRLDAAKGSVAEAVNAKAEWTPAAPGNGFAWTQTDAALPFPLDMRDPTIALALRASDFADTLDREMLTVTGLPAGSRHTLSCDGEKVAEFTAEALTAGVNLATLPTPMLRQALAVHDLTRKRNDVQFVRWRTVQVSLADRQKELRAYQSALAALDALEQDLFKEQRRAAVPKPHQFTLTPAAPVAPVAPAR